MTKGPGTLLHVFLKAPGARPLSMVACLMVAGLVEIVGMSLVIPFVAAMSPGGSGGPTRLAALGARVVGWLGVGQDFGVLLAVLAAALVAKSLVTLVAMTVVSRSVADVGLRLRRNLLDALMAADLGFFTAVHPGRIASTLVGDVTDAANAYNQAALAVTELLKLAGILVIASLISGWLFFAALAAAGLVSELLSRLVRLRRRAKRGQYEVADALFRRTEDTFASVKALKGMDRAEPSRRLIESGVVRIRREVLISQMSRHSINALQDIAMALALAGGIYVCVAWIRIGTAELLVLATLFLFMTNALRLLQTELHSFRDSAPAFAAVEAITLEARRAAETATGRLPVRFERAIVFEDVSFAHGHHTVLAGVSFEIAAGSITVLEGESGVGKTTTIDLVVGFHRPDAGRILVDGVPLADVSLHAWRSSIGYVPQELTLVEGSVFDNVVMGDDRFDRDAVWRALDLAGIGDFVRSLPDGLDAPVGVLGGKLSGGQRQRISLARALVGAPRLIILDEVTSALDLETEAGICSSLAALVPAVTILAITHRPAWTAIADAVLTFDGRGVTTTRRRATARPVVAS
jgi:ATP-binding cassette subfamily C protein